MNDISLTAILRLLQSAHLMEARLAGELSAVHGLSLNETFLLLQLDNAPQKKLPRVDLAKRLSMSASTVTRMAMPMEKCGFVSREADPRDARLAFVVLTESGIVRLAEAKLTLAKHAAAAFRDRWQADEVDQLSSLLSRMVAGFEGNLT